MIVCARRCLASILIFSLLLTNVPEPAAAAQVARVQAIDPLRPSATYQFGPAVATAVKPMKLGKVAALPASAYVRPLVKALAFHPFSVQDPATGKTVSRSATIYLPHEHRSVNAGKYYDDVNRLEQSLNSMGYTLRSHAAPTSCTSVYSKGKVNAQCPQAGLYARLVNSQQTEIMKMVRYRAMNPGHPILHPNVISELSRLDALVNPVQVQQRIPVPALVSVTPKIIAGIPTPTPPRHAAYLNPVICQHCNPAVLPTPKPHKCVNKSWFRSSWYGSYWYWATLVPDGIKDKSDRLPPLCHLPREVKLRGGLTSVSRNWKTTLGSPNPAGFYAGAGLQIGGNVGKQGISISASANSGAYLLGQQFDIASAKASTTGESGSLDLKVLNNTVWNPHGSHKFHDSKTFNQTFIQFQIPFNILWFQITLEASAQGSFGLQYGMTLAKQSSGFFIEPFVNVSATFSANFGIGIVIVSLSVGIYGTLVIAQFGLQFSASGTTWVPAEYTGKEKKNGNIIGCKLYFQYQLGLDDKFTALSGQTGVQAQACVDLFFWSNCWTAQVPIATWSGYSASDNIFTIPATPKWSQIGPWYTDRPQYGYPLQKGMAYSGDDDSGAPAVCHALGAK